MKKIYTIIAIMLLSAGAFAQTSNSIPLNNVQKQHLQTSFLNNHSHEKSTTYSFWIDLDSADSYQTSAFAGNYGQFAGFRSNGHYSWPADSNSSFAHGDLWNYMIVSFDTLVDSYHSGGPVPYSHSMIQSVTLDSLTAVVGQENNSGVDDTLLVQVLNVTGTSYFGSYPGSTILYTNTIVIPAATPLSSLGGNNPGNDYNNYVQINIGDSLLAAGLLMPANGKFAVKLTYLGAKTDTFAYFTGAPYFNGAGSCTGFDMADSSYYHPNTYSQWTAYNQLLPEAGGEPGAGDIWYPCTSSTTFAWGTDGANYFQDGYITAFVTIMTVGIQENQDLGIKLFQNVPNPFNGTSVISYELAKGGNVSMYITDIAGRTIKSFDEGVMGAGTHNITIDSKDIAQGIYFYTLNVDGIVLTNKMVVNK